VKPDGEGYTRQEGKTATLALGYQGALGSMLAMGATGSESELLALVARWREANPRIVALWRELEARFWSGGDVGELLHVTRSGRDRAIVLPSGRELVYHGVAKRRVRKKRDDGTTYDRDELSFIAPLPNAPRTPTYGGRLTENVTQAVARDVLAHALVRLEREGYRVVGHVHDEVLIEGEHEVSEVAALMCAPTSWNKGLPLDAAGYTTQRYRKE
jgi:DNA polymerase